VNQVSADHVDSLTQDKCRIVVRDLVEIVGLSVGYVEAIVHDELNFSKVSACWVQKLLSDEQKERQVQF
jgi:hypothetical protein